MDINAKNVGISLSDGTKKGKVAKASGMGDMLLV